jgi:hypothetical protein
MNQPLRLSTIVAHIKEPAVPGSIPMAVSNAKTMEIPIIQLRSTP